MANVTSKVTKSAGTATPESESKSTAKRGRKAIAPDERTVTIRGAKRRFVALLLSALDGDTAAIARLFGSVAPVEPVAPVLSDEDRTDASKVLAHVDALNAYALAVKEYPAALEQFALANLERAALRSAVWTALNDIPMRKSRKATATDSTN